MKEVTGFCPMGCGDTLFLAAGGHVTCTYNECPNPVAASIILEDKETDHIVKFDQLSWSVRHPLRERVDNRMFEECQLAEYLARLNCPPIVPGTYRARLWQGQWSWESLSHGGDS
jgi:hypothetical protein